MQSMILTAYKQNGQLHCTQPLFLLHQDKTQRVLFGDYHAPFIHHTRHRVFGYADEVALYFCLKGRPYLPAIVVNRQGERRLYCHIASPCEFGNGVVRFVDLDLDVVTDTDGEILVIDQDEYEQNKHQLRYPAPLMHLAEQGVKQVLHDIQAAFYPFDQTMHRFTKAVLDAGEGVQPLSHFIKNIIFDAAR